MILTQELLDNIKELRDKAYLDAIVLIQNFHLNQHTDVRITSLSKKARVLAGLHLAVHSLLESERNIEEYWEEHSLPQTEKEPPLHYLIMAEQFIRNGYVTSLYACVESSFRIYLEYLNPDEYATRTKSAIEVAKYLLKKQLANQYSEAYDAFNLLGKMRNTLHNNGVYRSVSGQPTSVDYRGATYHFTPDERVDFVDWELLLMLSRDLGEVLFQIARDDKLLDNDSVITDPSRI